LIDPVSKRQDAHRWKVIFLAPFAVIDGFLKHDKKKIFDKNKNQKITKGKRGFKDCVIKCTTNL
jgi:hypothetical protein